MFSTIRHYNFGCAESDMPKVLKISFIFLQYMQKNMGDEVDFLSADKHKSFLQVHSITLDVCSQACPKYQK